MSGCTSSWYLGRCVYLTIPPACTCRINCPIAGDPSDDSEWKYPPCPVTGDQESCPCYVGKEPSNSGSTPSEDPGKDGDDEDDDEDDDDDDEANSPDSPYRNPVSEIESCGLTSMQMCEIIKCFCEIIKICCECEYSGYTCSTKCKQICDSIE